MTLAYVYKWAHIPTLRWYVGSRTAKNCHPDDGYICSNLTISEMISLTPSEWTRTIIATGEPDAMYDLETDILVLFDARNDERSFNGHNNDFGLPISGEKHYMKQDKWRKIQSERMSGEKNPRYGKGLFGEDNPMYGVKRSQEFKASVSGKNNPMFGKKGSNCPSAKKCHTPLGWFDSIIDAANAHNVNECTIRRRISKTSEKYKEYYK